MSSQARDEDPIIELYKQGIDRTSIRENLRRSPQERLDALQELHRFAEEVRRAGDAARRQQKK